MVKKLFILSFVLLITGLFLIFNQNSDKTNLQALLPIPTLAMVSVIPSPTQNILGEKSTLAQNILYETAVVSRVVDGDTVELSDGRKLRYIGINTPESVDPRRKVECFGKEASDFNRSLVEGKTVQLEKDVSETDRFGRLLRYVYVDGLFVNEYLVKQGYAYASAYPPDVKYQEVLKEAQTFARENKKGLWESCKI